MKEENEKNKGGRSRLAEMVLKRVEGLPTAAANGFIEAFNEIPNIIKKALDEYYVAMDTVDADGGIEGVKKALEKLKKVCDANEYYKDLYVAAKSEANQEIAELYANGVMSV